MCREPLGYQLVEEQQWRGEQGQGWPWQQDGGRLSHRLVHQLDSVVIRGKWLGLGPLEPQRGGLLVLPHFQPLLQQGAGGAVGEAELHLVLA